MSRQTITVSEMLRIEAGYVSINNTIAVIKSPSVYHFTVKVEITCEYRTLEMSFLSFSHAQRKLDDSQFFFLYRYLVIFVLEAFKIFC